MMLNLFLDIGNTTTKLGFKQKNNKWNVFIFNTKKSTSNYKIEQKINEILNEWNQVFSKIFISSVVPNITNIFRDFFNKKNIEPHILNNKIKLNFSILTKDHEEIGADILANAAYASKKYKNALVISLGTATVISQIKNNQLTGISISPGVLTALNGLISNASKLSDMDFKYTSKITGQTTNEAIYIGSIKAHAFMIQEMIKNIDSSAEILITGGNYKVLKKNFQFKYKYVDQMVLRGLKILFDLNN